ncbi:MAG: Ig-like domain-containing protein [bacterium]|nr:Ig-like domain-containing protein [bacterium]
MNYYDRQIEKNKKQLLIGLGVGMVLILAGYLWTVLPVLLQQDHIVKFRFNNGEEEWIVSVHHNDVVQRIEDPIMEGYIFGGWALEDSLYNFDNQVTRNLVLEAVWHTQEEYGTTTDITRYEVIYDSNGGSAIENDSVIKHGVITKPEPPTKKGYTFVGWKENGEDYNFDQKVEGNVKLEAEWVKNPEGNNGSLEIAIGSESGTGTGIGTIVIPNTDTDEKPPATDHPSTSPSTEKVTSISITKSISLMKGTTKNLSVNYQPSNAQLTTLTWTSSNPKVAVVSSSGEITAVAAGATKITVKDTIGNTASCIVTVIENLPQVTSISISSNLKLEKGTSQTLSVSHKPSNAQLTTLTWTSNNTKVATVNNSGNITAVGTGTAKITVKDSLGNSATCTVTVINPTTSPSPSNTPNPPQNKVTSISIANNVKLEKGASQTLTVSHEPSNATLTKLTWSSSNSKVATVSSSGKITAVGTGTANITVKDTLNNYATCTVTVIQNPTSISITAGPLWIRMGDQKQLAVTFTPGTTTEKSITWSSSNNNIATVNSSGIVTGKSAGKVTIIARTSNGKEANTTVIVDSGSLNILEDTSFSKGFELWASDTSGKYACVNCNNPYWYITSQNLPNQFNTSNIAYQNGNYILNANNNGINNKLITYNKNGFMKLDINTFGASYSTEASGWPHLLLAGKYYPNNVQNFYSQENELRQKYNSFKDANGKWNDVIFNVDLKLDLMTKGNPIRGVQAAQYLSFIEIKDKKGHNMIWFGFNLFDDRAEAQGYLTQLDQKTQKYIYLLSTPQVYNGMGNSIYNNGNIAYGQWKTASVNVSKYIRRVVDFLNGNNESGALLWGRRVEAKDLYIGGFNIGYEIHGEYHMAMNMRNLKLYSRETSANYDGCTASNPCY